MADKLTKVVGKLISDFDYIKHNQNHTLDEINNINKKIEMILEYFDIEVFNRKEETFIRSRRSDRYGI